jgi:hypothetical protein
VVQEGVLNRFGQDNKFHQVLQPEQMPTILQKLHATVLKGHSSSNITLRKILEASYWWPTMNQGDHEYYRTYD